MQFFGHAIIHTSMHKYTHSNIRTGMITQNGNLQLLMPQFSCRTHVLMRADVGAPELLACIPKGQGEHMVY